MERAQEREPQSHYMGCWYYIRRMAPPGVVQERAVGPTQASTGQGVNTGRERESLVPGDTKGDTGPDFRSSELDMLESGGEML